MMLKPTKALMMILDALALALAAVCLVAAAAGQGGRFSARLDVLTHFAPFWLAGAGAAGLYGLIAASPGARPAILGCGFAGVLAAGALILPEMVRPIRPQVAAAAPRQIKVIQFNAWDRNADVQATADWIAAQKPDLVMMQETEAPIRQAMIHRGFHFQNGIARTAIFSRLQPTYAPFIVPMGDWKSLPSFSRATFTGPDGGFSVVAVHMNWPTDRDQAQNLDGLVRLLGHYPPDRLIVAGDFNLTPWSFALRRLDRRLGVERRDRALFSWPARLSPGGPLAWPLLPIDHLYAGRAWRTVSVARGPGLGSDHYPLIVRLALTD
jgi:endonuclease/exonuclease/phosphatase (EEP) superfamily protein YafD